MAPSVDVPHVERLRFPPLVVGLLKCHRACVPVPPQKLGGMFFAKPQRGTSSFAGVRMVSDAWGKRPGERVTVVGSDDGSAFWTLTGTLAGSSLTLDFSPMGGSAALRGDLVEGEIRWSDGTVWTRAEAPPAGVGEGGPGLTIDGFYNECAHRTAPPHLHHAPRATPARLPWTPGSPRPSASPRSMPTASQLPWRSVRAGPVLAHAVHLEQPGRPAGRAHRRDHDPRQRQV